MRSLAAAAAAQVVALVVATLTGPREARAGDLFFLKPSVQIGAHAETGGGLLRGAGLAVHEQGGGVAAALSLMAPVRPRVLVGIAGELAHSRSAMNEVTAVGRQSWNVAAVRAMARAEWWSRPPFARDSRHTGFYALAGAGWNWNGLGTTITYLAGAPAGTPGDLHIANRPGFELGGGMELSHKPDASFFVEAAWVFDRAPYRLAVFGEPDRRGTSDLSGVTMLIGVRMNPAAPSPDEREP